MIQNSLYTAVSTKKKNYKFLTRIIIQKLNSLLGYFLIKNKLNQVNWAHSTNIVHDRRKTQKKE